MTEDLQQIAAAEVVFPCEELDATVAFFVERLGFRIDTVMPADHPLAVVVSGHGLRIRLQRGAGGSCGVLRLHTSAGGDVGSELIAPNGTRIEFVAADVPLDLPPERPSLVVTKMVVDSAWRTGRAGMMYRDLIPDRQGGRFIASHIRVPDGGPVADYVHYHRVRFQLIYCYKGWGKVVYEDQGAPLVMREGDAVLQPPEIRHRVLECSPGFEVVEIACPAEHQTRADHVMALPTPNLAPEREFSGQRFVHSVAAAGSWEPWRVAGFEARDAGIAAATSGLASVCTVRPVEAAAAPWWCCDTELLFFFVLRGGFSLQCGERDAERMVAGDAFVIPRGMRHRFTDLPGDLELLEVTLPARFTTDTEEAP